MWGGGNSLEALEAPGSSPHRLHVLALQQLPSLELVPQGFRPPHSPILFFKSHSSLNAGAKTQVHKAITDDLLFAFKSK